jgi:dipeptidase
MPAFNLAAKTPEEAFDWNSFFKSSSPPHVYISHENFTTLLNELEEILDSLGITSNRKHVSYACGYPQLFNPEELMNALETHFPHVLKEQEA